MSSQQIFQLELFSAAFSELPWMYFQIISSTDLLILVNDLVLVDL